MWGCVKSEDDGTKTKSWGTLLITNSQAQCLCQMKGDQACYSTEMHDNIADKHTDISENAASDCLKVNIGIR
jgi:hypothetical protein